MEQQQFNFKTLATGARKVALENGLSFADKADLASRRVAFIIRDMLEKTTLDPQGLPRTWYLCKIVTETNEPMVLALPRTPDTTAIADSLRMEPDAPVGPFRLRSFHTRYGNDGYNLTDASPEPEELGDIPF